MEKMLSCELLCISMQTLASLHFVNFVLKSIAHTFEIAQVSDFVVSDAFCPQTLAFSDKKNQWVNGCFLQI